MKSRDKPIKFYSRFDCLEWRRAKSPRPDLTEVLDQSSRPLCLMPAPDAARLSLPRKDVALLMRDGKNRKILRLNSKKEFGFTADGFLPAGDSPDDYIRELLPDWARGEPEPLLVIPASAGTRRARLYVYEARCAYCPSDEALLPLHRNEYEALLSRGHAFCPVLNFVVQTANLNWI